ncbi:MAG: MMPL family transporter [Gammaproteobacteria bacterium]|nr:MMPL family transporter [Gammaproteobacteria bacterium]
MANQPRLTLVLLTAATAGLGWVAYDRFQINSNLDDLISQAGTWRDDFDTFRERFPDLIDTAVIVVSGTSYQGVEETTGEIEARLLARPDIYTAVYAPQNDPFFRKHALLYLAEDELDDMADRLSEAQPILTAVAEDPSLRGILNLVADGVANRPGAGLGAIVHLLATSAEAVVAGSDPEVRWTDEFFSSGETLHRLVFLKGTTTDFDEVLPNARIMSELRSLIAALDLSGDVRVRITGEIALSHEEIEAAISGVINAGWLAVVLLIAVLVLGVRSLKIIVATFLLLGVGVVWTSAYAMLSVGEYNTLSIVFLVMFFGLGVDFAIHYSLRYQEAAARPDTAGAGPGSAIQALRTTTESVGRAIAICTVTTALGFLGFWPTNYQGLADLGVISAGGMVIAAFLTFTLLPAFYVVTGPIRPHVMNLPSGDRLVGWLVDRRAGVFAVLAVLGVAAGIIASQSHFDYSVLALRDPNAESMQTLRLLQKENITTSYALTVLSRGPLDGTRLSALATVESVRTFEDYIPRDQEAKLFVLEDLQELLWSALEPARVLEGPSPGELQSSAMRLREVVGETRASTDQLLAIELRRLDVAVGRLLELPAQKLQIWQQGVIGNLLKELVWLREAVNAGPVEFEDLPERLRTRLLSSSGDYLSTVIPRENTAKVEALSRFIESVREEIPYATGRPVIEWGVGNIVVDAFRQALLFAIAGIVVVLALAFRNLRDGLLILIPLALATLFTLGAGVLLDWPLNMANILVLPLIFGLGVDNGIHVVDRYRGEGDVEHLMHSSTPRAVMLSTLTTIGTFAALSLSPHHGTASIGILLTVAVTLLLILTIFVLPVLLSFVSRSR